MFCYNMSLSDFGEIPFGLWGILFPISGIFTIRYRIVPVDGMRDLLQDLKDRGFRLFVLSNTCVHWRSFWEEIPGHDLFEDVLISAEVGLVKPQPEIFRLACERFGISAGESVFIDDTPANAEAAYYVGMRAVVFHGDTAELRRELETVRETGDGSLSPYKADGQR